jgi:hypothetical protein
MAEIAPKEKPSSYMLEGTMAHEISEFCLIWGLTTDVFRFKYFNTYFENPDESKVAIDYYLNYINQIINNYESYLVEAKVRLNKDVYGTADFIGLDDMLNTLVVCDFKHGVGVPVGVRDNPQIIIYGLAALNHVSNASNYDHILLSICQPRIKSGKKIKEWLVSFEELKDQWLPRIERAINRVKKHPHTYIIGNYCYWCPGSKFSLCPEQQNKKVEEAKEDFK